MRRVSSAPPELPGYTFVKLLGSGGFSDVFLYDQKLPKRRVAVKVLLTEELTAANRAAFVAEANLMAQLSAHPYIVTIYQADVAADDRPYFVMEYCSGPSLAERYKREVFSVADALRTGVRLSSAVATAHAAGILHRDIKPGNVLGNDYGWPALTDFGISSALDDDALPAHTTTMSRIVNDTSSTGQSVGMSVPWSPPEMFEDDPQPDVRSDVFSLAATIYTILAGQTPFEVRGRSNGTLDLIGRIERGAITPMARDDVPRSLLSVLQKGMASDRSDRFETAVDFARALQRVELELGYAPTTIDVPNLLVAAPDRDSQEDDADETRARGVATVHAQPAPAIISPLTEPAARGAVEHAAGTAAESAATEATVLRGSRGPAAPLDGLSSETVVRPRRLAEPEAGPAEPPPVAEPASRARRVLVWVAGGVAVLVAASVALSLVLGGVPGGGGPEPEPTGTGGPVVVEAIPTPQLVSAVANGTTVTFTVENPDPVDGDSFVWANRAVGDQRKPVEGDTIVVSGYVPGSTLCIQVEILRAGKTSANPLDTCYPAS